MKGSFGSALAVLLAGCAAGAVQRAAPAGGWRTEPPMLHARSAHAVAGSDQAVYVIAGSGERGPVLEVERFDGRSWRVETTLPGDGLNAPAAALVGDRLYVIGGFGGLSNVPTDRVAVYDLRTRSWSEAARLPAPRGGHAAAVHEGRIHVFGGGNARSTIADHDVYDPATDRWRTLAPLPRAMGSPAGVVADGRVWSIGGRSGSSDFGDVHVYDAARDAWLPGPPIEPRGTAGAVRYRGAIHLFGGESQARGVTLSDVLRLDPSAGTWTLAASLPSPRNYARAVVLGDRVYVIGGNPTGGASHSAAGSRLVESWYLPR